MNTKEKRRNLLKAIVTGFYHGKERDFVVPKIKVQRTKLSSLSFYPDSENTKFPVVTFQLMEGKRVFKRIKQPVFKMQIKILYKNTQPITRPFEFSPIIVAFKLPSDYKERELKIVALESFGKKIYSVSIPKKQKREPKPKSKDPISLVENSKRR